MGYAMPLTPITQSRKTPPMITWATRIEALRATGMTHAAIGVAVGLSTSAVCDIERGRTKKPRGDAALALDALYRRQIAARARRTPSTEPRPARARSRAPHPKGAARAT